MRVRGKDFRHEKTKKKRGSYRGGLIDMGAVKSIKLGVEYAAAHAERWARPMTWGAWSLREL